MPFAVVVAAFAPASGSVAHVSVGASGVPVAGADFLPAAEPFAVAVGVDFQLAAAEPFVVVVAVDFPPAVEHFVVAAGAGFRLVAEPFAVAAGADFLLAAEPSAVVVSADFPPVAVVAGAFVRDVEPLAAVAASAFAAAAVASVPAWHQVCFAADDPGDSNWQRSEVVSYSAGLRQDDQGDSAWLCLGTGPCLVLLTAAALADLSWRYLATAPCSVVLKGDDRCEFVNFAVGPVAPAGLKTLEVKLPEAQQRNAFHSVFEIGQACCGRRFQQERVLL